MPIHKASFLAREYLFTNISDFATRSLPVDLEIFFGYQLVGGV